MDELVLNGLHDILDDIIKALIFLGLKALDLKEVLCTR